MKTLKIILVATFFTSLLVSCTPQDGIITDATVKVQNSTIAKQAVYATGKNGKDKLHTHNGG